ncbi:hypothetical protein EV127DRAFT_60170 [Xylaria flabelliformis]|nr:hypothetical protein EV127DRAFT_60170 [Xylaria flabelliformis]
MLMAAFMLRVTSVDMCRCAVCCDTNGSSGEMSVYLCGCRLRKKRHIVRQSTRAAYLTMCDEWWGPGRFLEGKKHPHRPVSDGLVPQT